MNIHTKREYDLLTKEQQDDHHSEIRKGLIEDGTIKPQIVIKPTEE